MQTDHRIFDDLSKLANSAVSTLGAMRDEIEALVRQQVERLVDRMDLVPREEFEAVKDMAVKAREENETLAAQLKKIEAQLAMEKAGPKTETKTASTAKTGKSPTRRSRTSSGAAKTAKTSTKSAGER